MSGGFLYSCDLCVLIYFPYYWDYFYNVLSSFSDCICSFLGTFYGALFFILFISYGLFHLLILLFLNFFTLCAYMM